MNNLFYNQIIKCKSIDNILLNTKFILTDIFDYTKDNKFNWEILSKEYPNIKKIISYHFDYSWRKEDAYEYALEKNFDWPSLINDFPNIKNIVMELISTGYRNAYLYAKSRNFDWPSLINEIPNIKDNVYNYFSYINNKAGYQYAKSKNFNWPSLIKDFRDIKLIVQKVLDDNPTFAYSYAKSKNFDWPNIEQGGNIIKNMALHYAEMHHLSTITESILNNTPEEYLKDIPYNQDTYDRWKNFKKGETKFNDFIINKQGNIIEIKNLEGQKHNPNGPARKVYYSNHKLKIKTYLIKDKQHNRNGPAFEQYYPNGQLEHKAYSLNGKHHNPNGPAYEYYHQNGQLNYKSYWINHETVFSFDNNNNELKIENISPVKDHPFLSYTLLILSKSINNILNNIPTTITESILNNNNNNNNNSILYDEIIEHKSINDILNNIDNILITIIINILSGKFGPIKINNSNFPHNIKQFCYNYIIKTLSAAADYAKLHKYNWTILEQEIPNIKKYCQNAYNEPNWIYGYNYAKFHNFNWNIIKKEFPNILYSISKYLKSQVFAKHNTKYPTHFFEPYAYALEKNFDWPSIEQGGNMIQQFATDYAKYNHLPINSTEKLNYEQIEIYKNTIDESPIIESILNNTPEEYLKDIPYNQDNWNRWKNLITGDNIFYDFRINKENSKISIKNLEGKLHNPIGPAREFYHKNGQLQFKEYLRYGQYHNQNGPAIERYHENGQLYYKAYYIQGKQIFSLNPSLKIQKITTVKDHPFLSYTLLILSKSINNILNNIPKTITESILNNNINSLLYNKIIEHKSINGILNNIDNIITRIYKESEFSMYMFDKSEALKNIPNIKELVYNHFIDHPIEAYHYANSKKFNWSSLIKDFPNIKQLIHNLFFNPNKNIDTVQLPFLYAKENYCNWPKLEHNFPNIINEISNYLKFKPSSAYNYAHHNKFNWPKIEQGGNIIKKYTELYIKNNPKKAYDYAQYNKFNWSIIEQGDNIIKKYATQYEQNEIYKTNIKKSPIIESTILNNTPEEYLKDVPYNQDTFNRWKNLKNGGNIFNDYTIQKLNSKILILKLERNLNRICHNPDGPAKEQYFDSGQLWHKSYCINGKFHNPNGPAYQEYYPNGILFFKDYVVNGVNLFNTNTSTNKINIYNISPLKNYPSLAYTLLTDSKSINGILNNIPNVIPPPNPTN